jgi:hypothetical protein
MEKSGAFQRCAEEAAFGIGFRLGIGQPVMNVGQFYALIRDHMIDPSRLEKEQEYGRRQGEDLKKRLEQERKTGNE